MHYCIVKKNTSLISAIPVAIILIVTAVLSYLATPVFPYLTVFIAAAGILFSLWLLPRCLNREYEYTIEGDLFTVALIRNKSSRKELFSTDIANLVSCAPFSESDTNASVNQKINVSTTENTLYYALFSDNENTTALVFSPSDEFVNSLRLLAPRKVKCNILH